MRIGKLASLGGCSAETIRYYEKEKLLPEPHRLENSYRDYGNEHLKWLQFILRCRKLGFSQSQVRELAAVSDLKNDVCDDVHELLLIHIADVEAKLDDLLKMKASLKRLELKCRDDTLHSCPVIDELMA
jgi:MerR family mercuric resistance operon transcriptional regulator